jgi:uncharacterized protein YjbI with pentapeptide repeats
MIELDKEITSKLPMFKPHSNSDDIIKATRGRLNFEVHSNVISTASKKRLLGSSIIFTDPNESYVIVTRNDDVTVIGNSEFEITTARRLFEHSAFNEIDLTNTVLSNKIDNLDQMFEKAVKVQKITLGKNWDTSRIATMNRMFQSCYNLVEILNTDVLRKATPIQLNSMFSFCNNLKAFDMKDINFSNVISMQQFMIACRGLTSLNINDADFGSLEEAYEMFAGTSIIKADMSGMNLTSIYTFDRIFDGCVQLKEIDLTGAKFDQYSTFDSMTYDCINLDTIKIDDTEENRELFKDEEITLIENRMNPLGHRATILWCKPEDTVR